jgi:DNA-directed RNA polymerase subunit RPC12/RpoP
MSKKNESLTLKCASCGHENEPERVYCHNCGSKLDRSLIPKTVAEKNETPEQAQARVKKMMNPSRGGAGYNHVKIGVQVVIFAVIVAAVFLIWQKPDDVPEAKNDGVLQRSPGDLWDTMMGLQTANSLPVTEADMNLYLKGVIKANEGGTGIKFVRSVVNLKPGLVTVFVERDVWGLKMYSSATYKPVVRGGKVAVDIIDTRIGRLGIHPGAPAAISNWAVSGISNAFEKEIKQSDRLSEIRVEEGRIQFITKPL